MRVPVKHGRKISMNRLKLYSSLMVEDLNKVRDSIELSDEIKITTDVWTVNTQLHIKTKAYVVAKYPYFCIVEFPWHNSKGLIFLQRVLSYTELLLAYRHGTVPNISAVNKSIDKEVNI